MQSVADKMDCPVGTIKSRLHNARLKIADCVKNAFNPGVVHV
jgi:DNA-directed RNA polymerase specialized sigma24 family protein